MREREREREKSNKYIITKRQIYRHSDKENEKAIFIEKRQTKMERVCTQVKEDDRKVAGEALD